MSGPVDEGITYCGALARGVGKLQRDLRSSSRGTFSHSCAVVVGLGRLRPYIGKGNGMIKFGFAVLMLTICSGGAIADPLEGLWQTEADDGAFAYVDIAPCGANFCGKIARAFKDGAEYASPNRGKTLVIDMAPEGNGKYKGKVWRPSNDKIYIGKIALDGDRMRLSGCVAGGLLCSKQMWSRVE